MSKSNAWGITFIAAAIFALRWWILAWAVLFVLGLGIRSLYRAYRRHEYAKAVYAESLRQRATSENAAMLEGNLDYGIYGNYTPYTIPTTKPLYDPYLFGGQYEHTLHSNWS